MCLQPTYTPHLARRRRPSSALALAPARACSAHRLPHARCCPGPARASAGGDLSARGLRKAPRLRLREGVGAEIFPAARCRPGCIGTGRSGVAARAEPGLSRPVAQTYSRVIAVELQAPGPEACVPAPVQHCTAARSRSPAPRGLQLSMNYSLLSVRSHLPSARRISSSKPSAPAAYRACEQGRRTTEEVSWT